MVLSSAPALAEIHNIKGNKKGRKSSKFMHILYFVDNIYLNRSINTSPNFFRPPFLQVYVDTLKDMIQVNIKYGTLKNLHRRETKIA